MKFCKTLLMVGVYCISNLIIPHSFSNATLQIFIIPDDIPAVEEFKQMCRSHTVTPVSDLQFFRQLFNHSFFSHRFIYIYNFLFDLPVKNEAEKTSFFEFVFLSFLNNISFQNPDDGNITWWILQNPCRWFVSISGGNGCQYFRIFTSVSFGCVELYSWKTFAS